MDLFACVSKQHMSLPEGVKRYHFPHLPHVLVVNQLVKFWDKFGREKGEMWQCDFLNTTRFGHDVVLSTLSCHEDDLTNLLIVKKAHGKPRRHDSLALVHGMSTSSLFLIGHLSGLYVLILVPLLQFLDNLSMDLNVLCIWFALLHLFFRTTSQSQVVPGADGPEKAKMGTLSP